MAWVKRRRSIWGVRGRSFFPTWSPDGKKIAYTDKRLNLWYVDLEKKTPVRVAHDRFTGPQQIFRAAWSPDSKWLAYTQQGLSHMRSVFLYSLETGESHRVTDGMSDAFSPVFDKSGKYLYLLASTDDGPDDGWFDDEHEPARVQQRLHHGSAQGPAFAARPGER